jgi:hypothetical protein
MIASNWRAMRSGMRIGLFDLTLASGLVLAGCGLFEKDGKRWVGLPSCRQVGRDGAALLSPKTQRPVYRDCVKIPDSAVREKFQRQALAAVDQLLNRGGEQ